MLLVSFCYNCCFQQSSYHTAHEKGESTSIFLCVCLSCHVMQVQAQVYRIGNVMSLSVLMCRCKERHIFRGKCGVVCVVGTWNIDCDECFFLVYMGKNYKMICIYVNNTCLQTYITLSLTFVCFFFPCRKKSFC